MMNEQRTDIVEKFESIISELVKKKVTTALKPLPEIVSLQSGTTSELQRSDQITGEHGYTICYSGVSGQQM